MSFMCMFFLIAFAVFVTWIVVNYVRLVVTANSVKKLFFDFENLVKTYIDEMKDTGNEWYNWYVDSDDINRKLAIISSIVKEKDIKFDEKTENAVKKYNKQAENLKKLVEIFPTSFIARFMLIKRVHQFDI